MNSCIELLSQFHNHIPNFKIVLYRLTVFYYRPAILKKYVYIEITYTFVHILKKNKLLDITNRNCFSLLLTISTSFTMLLFKNLCLIVTCHTLHKSSLSDLIELSNIYCCIHFQLGYNRLQKWRAWHQQRQGRFFFLMNLFI